MGVLLLPDVERGFAYANLAADVGTGRAAFDLPQRVVDLLFRELRALYVPTVLELGGPQNLSRLLQL